MKMKWLIGTALLVIVAAGASAPIASRSLADGVTAASVRLPGESTSAQDAYGRLPLAFVPGQPRSQAPFVAQGGGYSFAFKPDEMLLSFAKGERAVTLGLGFVGASPRGVEAQGRLPGAFNDLRGNDPARWRTAVPTYSTLVYRELWRGIDLRLQGASGTLKYEFLVRPGARVSDIRLAYRGVTGLRLARDGALRVGTPLGALRDSPPVSYQVVAGRRVAVPSRYTLAGQRAYGFAAGPYDAARPLVIDPGLEYSTFLGGTGDDFPGAIAVDQHGNAFVTGHTFSPDYPTMPGAFDRTFDGTGDAFVTKLNRAGAALIYSTLLGGTSDESGFGIAVDEKGNAYIAGFTQSEDHPTTPGAFDRTFNGGPPEEAPNDAFVTKLNRAGSAVVYSTFLGGTNVDVANSIAVDEDGNAFVFGWTQSPDYPTTAGAFDETLNVDPFLGFGSDSFVTKLNRAGSALVYSTFLGGTSDELLISGRYIAVDEHGSAYVTGGTFSADYPTTAGAFDRTLDGSEDAFVTKLNRAGSALVYSTFLGGASGDHGRSIALDERGNAFVTGSTVGRAYPTTPGAFDPTDNPGFDAFVTKLDRYGSALVYSTFLGAAAQGRGIAVDEDGNAVVTGATRSEDYPTTAGAFDPTFDGLRDGFVTELDRAGSALVYSTFLGGTELGTEDDPLPDQPNAVALDENGNAYVTGITGSPDFPTTRRAFDVTYNGGLDAFVTKLELGDGDD